ncbi:MAG TPA: SDR family NAD(P)-dependent oxidoreductase [Myxococcales bacterium]
MEREDVGQRAVAVVGVSAILPDAPDAKAFWQNVLSGKDSITEVPRDRWDPADYWDPDPAAPDKTYCKIGAFVRGFTFDSLRFRIPPRVVSVMDPTQQWMLCCAREALLDAGHPDRGGLDPSKIAVVLGNALGGEQHEKTSMRAMLPEAVRGLREIPEFQGLPADVQEKLVRGMLANTGKRLPLITEDTMPGELGNVIAGRITNALDLGGMNFTADAACASSLAALQSAIGVLVSHQADAVVAGGVDRSMGPATYVKFAKIGALSPDGSRPFDAGANGFVMGEGAVAFILKRLEDAERAGDKIYAVIRGVGGSSDGKGKGITAPNPNGQILSIRRAYEQAGVHPRTIGLIEAHGTSTKVGDAAEAESLTRAFADSGLKPGSVALGSIKSQIGHLKSAAGAAGLLKAVLAVHHGVLPPSINLREPNPGIPFDRVPFYVNTRAQTWERPADAPRRAAVSSFGFGGTNFHVVVEEHVPGLLTKDRKATVAVKEDLVRTPDRGMLCLGAADVAGLRAKLAAPLDAARSDRVPAAGVAAEDLAAPERLVFTYASAADFKEKAEKTFPALDSRDPRLWKAMRLKGVYRGSGPAPKVAFLFPGQGSQYVGMLGRLREKEPIVRDTFAEADAVMEGKLPKRLTEYLFGSGDPEAMDLALRDTQVCQPAMLAVDLALLRLLAAHGIKPDMVMGHSLGEYAALVASGAMPFADAVLAVSARAKEMASVSIADNGKMASIFAPETQVREVLSQSQGYVVAANFNSRNQTVIGGATAAVEDAVKRFEAMGVKAVFLPVSHAFHTEIVAPASRPLRSVLARLNVQAPTVPLVSNVTGELYPSGPDSREKILDLLARQIAAPVQFVRGLETLYRLGARVFVEIGPKKVLASFAEDVLSDKPDVVAAFTNHPKKGDIESFAEALAGLYAAGLGRGQGQAQRPAAPDQDRPYEVSMSASDKSDRHGGLPLQAGGREAGYQELGRMFASFLETGFSSYQRHFGALPGQADPARPALVARAAAAPPVVAAQPAPRAAGSVVVSGASLGLPGRSHKVFDDANVDRMLAGEMFIEAIPAEVQRQMVDRRVVRLVKDADGNGKFETISDPSEVLKLAGQKGEFNLAQDYGIAPERVEAFDITTKLAVAAALDALRDAGIPLVRRYKQTTKGTLLPDRWTLPESMADETGVVFASAFPGYTALLDEVGRFHEDRSRRERLAELVELRSHSSDGIAAELDSRITELQAEIARTAYAFDRKFLFHVLSMGHSQLAELIGARGPNSSVNAACASAAQAVGIAHDWIKSGRCRRVVVVSADDITNEKMLPWFGTGFLASGAASTESDVSKAALPFDRRRHGLIVGMGASGLVLEAEDAVRERGMRGIVELLGVEVCNSAFHGSRLDVSHIGDVMERLVSRVEKERGIDRKAIAGNTVFVSHETYTPARGGSAAAEIHSLRRVFGERAREIVIANTKGLTGHPMGAGLEEAVAVKILEKGIVPAVPNLKEPDPELGDLTLSKGGRYPVRFALRLAAGFGSQIVITLMQKVKGPRQLDARVYERWLAEQSGRPSAQTEIAHRTLRVRDDGPPTAEMAKSRWNFGQSPALLAELDQAMAAVAPAAPLPAPAARAAVAEAAAQPVADPIAEKVLAIVSAKTGYPREMLALDLDLEADLGIDTVKQAEVFAEVRGAFDLPRRDDMKLRDYPTLNHIIGLVRQARPDLAAAAHMAAPVAVAVPAAAGTTAAPSNSIAEKLLAVVSAKTGYPRDMLALDLDLEADLGIDTVKQAEIFADVRTAFDLPRSDDFKLRDYPTLNHLIGFVAQLRPELATAAPEVSAPSAAQAPAFTTPAPAPVASAAAATADPVAEKLLEVVAAKTGYPRDMLALDLDLEADLGIDTVKQAEIFADVRTAFDLPRSDDFKLRDYPTLNHLIGFVRSVKPELAPAPVAAAPAAAAASAPAPAKPAAGADPVAEKLLEVVAAKTGYPRDMLALDLDLEADLGIDTVKQAEIFAEIRGAFDLPRRDDMKLRDYPTLNHLIALVHQLRGGAGAPAATAQAAASTATTDKLTPVSAVRRVPVPVLRPELELCKPTGVELGAGKRVAILGDRNGVAAALTSELASRGVELLSLESANVEDEAKAWLAKGNVDGVFVLSALDPEPELATATLDELRPVLDERVRRLARLARVLSPSLNRKGAFFMAATRMGGLHGYGAEPTALPVSGAVCGFTKALGRECPEMLAKAVDFASDAGAQEIAQALVAEAQRDPGVVEVGRAYGSRHGIGLSVTEWPTSQPRKLGPDHVFLITGAAGGITSVIVRDLAAASRGTFWLLDLAPLPDASNPDLARLSDRDGLRRDLFERLKKTSDRVTPAQVEKLIAGLERDAAVLDAIHGVEAAGGRVNYRAVDARDPKAMDAVLDEVKAQHGKIDVVLHAAGFEKSRMLADKPQEEFDRIFDVKVLGLANLLRASAGMPIGAMVCFSSVAGRFGNLGQTDYSSANDLLCKAMLGIRRTRPETKALAIDWTAWGGVGMATRGSIPEMMRRAGIDMLDPAEGVPVIRHELEAGNAGEMVVGGALGMLVQAKDAEGGLDVAAVATRLAEHPLPMVSRVLGMDLYGGLAIETVLDPVAEPFLHDHEIDGVPVLPGVMGLEGFAEVAQLVAPDHRVESIEAIRFEAPMKYYRRQARPAVFRCVLRREGPDRLIAEINLTSQRTLASGETSESRHFTGRVILTRQAAAQVQTDVPSPNGHHPVSNDAIYRIYFHGPAYQVLDGVELCNHSVRSRFRVNLPPALARQSPTVMAPRVIELVLQTAGVYEIARTGRLALPAGIERIVSHATPSEDAQLFAEVFPKTDGGDLRFDAKVCDETGRVYLEITGYRTSALPTGLSEDLLKPLRRSLEEATA